jgi:tetratricopeptide (TPR) repeat protein
MKKISLLVAVLFVGASLFAQKLNVTNAHNALKNYVPIIGNTQTNRKALKEAKEAIDLAAVNSETASALDMHRYRAIIYFSLIESSTVEAGISKTQPDESLIKEYEAKMKESIDFVLSAPNDIKKSKTEKQEVKDFVNAKSQIAFNMGLESFNTRNYEQATQLFIGAYEISKYINDENAIAKDNAILSFRRACDTLTEQSKFDEANKLGDVMLEFTPKSIEVIISLVNVNLQKKDMAASEKLLNMATNIDSTNKQLFLVLGTSLMEIEQPEKASEAFIKALKLDPNYSDVIYQYCTMLFNWSIELRNTASDLKINDPIAKDLEKKANKNLNTNIQILEPYIKSNPNDTIAIEIAWRTFSFLSNDVKHYEYKDKWFFVRDSLVSNKLILDINNTSINFLKLKILSDWSKDFKVRAEDIDVDEVKADLIAKSKEINKRTSDLLNKYVERNPNDKSALEVGWKVYDMLEDEVKSAALKKQWEALK